MSPTLAGLHCGSVFVTYLFASLQPYTVNFKCAFKYFLKIERPQPRALHLVDMAVLGYCQSAAMATVAESTQI